MLFLCCCEMPETAFGNLTVPVVESFPEVLLEEAVERQESEGSV